MLRIITFGTYDIFHVGHLRLLQRARALGDHLTVGVSTDELNLPKKGRRPVYPFDERCEILSNLAVVDHVFAEESLEAKRDYILQHRADVLVMGDDWEGRFERTPGGPDFALRNVVLMRLREVEIHHADLAAGYAPDDWSEGFRVVLLESMTKRPYPAAFTVRPTDLDGAWHYGGEGGPVVSGTSAALGWWLTGRGAGEGLVSDDGELPEVEAW